jgi:hypothetical protein
MSDEGRLHDSVERLRGEWTIKTQWGAITVALRPYRVGYGSKKGTPDELLLFRVTFPLFGEEVSLQLPIFLEMEASGGMPASIDDIEKFVKRMASGEEEDIYYKYAEVPMFAIGKKRATRTADIMLRAKIKMREVPGL